MQPQQQEQTAWDVFFGKCATDSAYREELAEALQRRDQDAVIAVLERAGFRGGDQERRAEALKDAYGPLLELARSFGAPEAFLAP
jgi:hypothetical protein